MWAWSVVSWEADILGFLNPVTWLRQVALLITIAALAFSGGWLYRGHYAGLEQKAALADANTAFNARMTAYQKTTARMEAAYARQAQKLDAANAAAQAAIHSVDGGRKDLDPFLAHAAGVLWPAPRP